MEQGTINNILCQMIPYLSNDQVALLKNVLEGAMLKSSANSEETDSVYWTTLLQQKVRRMFRKDISFL